MKTTKLAAALLVAVILIGAVTALAAQGGQEDPLVTLSYLTGVLTPKLEGEVTKAVTANEKALTDKLDASIAAYQKQVDALLSKSGGTGAHFQSVALPKGESRVGLGEYLLRSGTAKAKGELADSTGGTVVQDGGSLTANHLYIALDATSGVAAVTDATLLIKGN
ncbi:MAG: hypothetical protein RSB55_09140 [Oscillospiraceae bacterium]